MMITGDRLIGRTAVLALLLAGSAAYAEAILAQRIQLHEGDGAYSPRGVLSNGRGYRAWARTPRY